MEKHEKPDIVSSSLVASILTIVFSSGDTHQWEGVPVDVYTKFSLNPTFDNFALLIRPHYKLIK